WSNYIYCDYLKRHGFVEEANRVHIELEEAGKISNILHGAFENSPISKPLMPLISWWLACLLVLCNAFWIAVLGLLAVILASPRDRTAKNRPVRAWSRASWLIAAGFGLSLYKVWDGSSHGYGYLDWLSDWRFAAAA